SLLQIANDLNKRSIVLILEHPSAKLQGTVWTILDSTTSSSGALIRLTSDGRGETGFLGWYENWLDESLNEVEQRLRTLSDRIGRQKAKIQLNKNVSAGDYLALLELLIDADDPAEAHRVLQQAQRLYPTDIQILLTSMQLAAGASKSSPLVHQPWDEIIQQI